MGEDTTGSPFPTIGNWGPWRFDREWLIIQHEPTGYFISLENTRTSAGVLNWLCQVAGKVWADDATLAGLIRAFKELYDAQATLCSDGIEQGPVEPLELLR